MHIEKMQALAESLVTNGVLTKSTSNISMSLGILGYSSSEVFKRTTALPSISIYSPNEDDKELSEFTDTTIGASLTYIVPKAYQPFDWPAEMSVQWDRIDFDYHNFRDLQQQAPIGEEPLYQFSADVVRVFASIYF